MHLVGFILRIFYHDARSSECQNTNETWNLSTYFRKKKYVRYSRKYVKWEPNCSMRTARQIWRSYQSLFANLRTRLERYGWVTTASQNAQFVSLLNGDILIGWVEDGWTYNPSRELREHIDVTHISLIWPSWHPECPVLADIITHRPPALSYSLRRNAVVSHI